MIKSNFYLFCLLLTLFISCKQEQVIKSTAGVNYVERSFNRDSIVLEELTAGSLISFCDNEVKYIDQLLKKGKLDSLIMSYDCPNILDKGKLIVFKENKEVKYILHKFQNGKQKGSVHKYYLFKNQLFLSILRDGYWSFEHGIDERSSNISTDSKYYFNGLKGLECISKKFAYTEQDIPDLESSKINFEQVSCSKSRVILSKFRLIQSIINNPKRVDKPCIFY